MSDEGTSGRPPGRTVARLLAVAAVLWAAALVLQAARDQRYPALDVESDLLYLRAGPAVPRLALGFDALLADLYWIRAIQHYGDTRLSTKPDKQYRLLYPLLDLVTTLDPRFTVAYRFGAIFLAEPYPDGPGRTDLAIGLLERGLRADPARWQFAQDAGFVYYWWAQDYKAAASWFDRAARIEGAPWWLRSMAASTLAQGGDRRSSRQLWRQLYETAEHEWVKNNAQLKLLQLDALDGMDTLAGLVRRYTTDTGRFPDSWAALGALGWLRGIPTDPSGTAFVLDRSQPGGVALAPSSPLYPIPAAFTKKAGPTS
jgi:tetratricopeptide (TPR) repeat protein